MATKKKKQPKNDYLKLAAVISVAVILAGNLYLWWDGAEPLTSVSTSFSTLWWSLLIPAFIGISCFLFWFLMAIDAWKTKKIIWFLFILLGPILIGVLYLLVEKPNILKRNARRLGWLAIAFFLSGWLFITLSELKMRMNSSVEGSLVLVNFTGSLVSKDSDGPGIYKIKTKTGIVRVDVGPASSCLASEVPSSLKAGDKVRVQAGQNGDKSYSVCEFGTYIKNL